MTKQTAPALDADAQRLMQAMMDSGAPPLESLPPSAAREAARAGLAPLAAPGPQDVTAVDRTIDGPHGDIPLRLYRPPGVAGDAALPVLLFWHGGGFVLGGVPAVDGLCRQLCARLGCMVVSAGYHLAPECRFPAQVEEAQATLRWLAVHAGEIGGDAERIALGGESAGANLAAVTALAERDAGTKTIGAQLLLYPVVDFSPQANESPSYAAFATGYFVNVPMMAYLRGHYLGAADGSDWRASPLRAGSHADLPPAVVAVCGYDPLRDEGIAYAETLRAAGVTAELVDCATQMHAFLVMDAAIPSALTDLDRIVNRFQAVWRR